MKANTSRNLASIWLVLKASVQSFGANRNLEMAAALAFYGFLSLMPLLLLTVILLGVVMQSWGEAEPALGRLLQDLIPSFEPSLLTGLANITHGGALGLVGIVLLVWSMTPLSGALRTALARMFVMPVHRPFLRSKVLDLLAVLCFLLLFMMLVGVKLLITLPAGTDSMGWRVLSRFLGEAGPFALSVAFIGLIFRVFSPVRLTWHQWLLGAVCVTLLWTVMRHLFVVFVQINPNYGYAFGSLKAIFLLLVWVYYSFAVLLFGAEIMANTYRRDALLLKRLLEPAGPGKDAGRPLMRKFERVLAEGETLFREGDTGAEMYVVLEGEIRLEQHGHVLARMQAGQYFGEMTLLTHAPRSATAVAGASSRLAVVTQENFDLLVRENPMLVRRLLEELARRLAETNLKLRQD